jgi:FecR protein
MTHIRVGRVLALFAAVLLATPLVADSQARIIRLSNVQGNVEIDRRTGDGRESALENLPVTEGMRISTSDDGRAEIEFEDGSTLRLAPNTSIEFARLSLRDSGGKNTEVELSEGTAYFNIDLGKRDDFVVDLGHRSIQLDRSARFRASVDRTHAHVAVSHGQVDVLGIGSSTVTVSRNRTGSFDLEDQDNYSEARGYEDSAYDDWDSELDSYHERNFNRNSNDSPYVYGFSDLNYYGSYFNAPGLGSCWRPFFAGAGWDPFADGTWVWYPGFGYTWVSSYPWGWAPYRYGSWNFVQSNGWCWQPGGWNQWASIPRVVNTPVGWKFPPPPPNGHGRVPRIHGNTVEGGMASRFGDPTRRVVREGPDGRTIQSYTPQGEAGLGVPRGHLNLRTFTAPPPPGRGGFGDGDYGDRSGRTTSNGNGGGSAPRGSAPPPRSAPAPRMAPPAPAPRMSPSPSPAPAPRGSKG